MNKRKWKSAPIPLIALKLCEEAAEVGTEISDYFMAREFHEPEENMKMFKRDLRTEIEHVEFLCDLLRERWSLGPRK